MYLIPSFSGDLLSIFEIYPQSEMSFLTPIAHLDRFSSELRPTHFLLDTLICRAFYNDRIIFGVVDNRTYYSTCFTADVKVRNFDSDGEGHVEVLFILSKTLKLSSNYLLGRHLRRTQVLSSPLKKEY